jgi:hypothetical protein
MSNQHIFEQTVKEQFEAAIVHIEGIAAIDWPQISHKELVFAACCTNSV